MTHLGIVSAIATAARGFRVIGHDAEASLVGRLDRQYFPILKPDLDRLLAAKRDRISFTATASDLSDCDIVYIAADVPTDDKGASDLAAISARPNRPDLTSSRGRRCSCCSLPSAARLYTLRLNHARRSFNLPSRDPNLWPRRRARAHYPALHRRLCRSVKIRYPRDTGKFSTRLAVRS